MKKTFLAVSLLSVSSVAFAEIKTAEEIMNNQVKTPVAVKQQSGFSVHGGIVHSMGDLVDDSDTVTGFTIGADYTFDGGFVLGFTYAPEVVSDSATIYGVTGEADASATTIYGMYQMDTGWRVGGGLTKIDVDATISGYGYSVSDSESDVGFTLKGGYLFDNNFVVDGGLTFVEVLGEDITQASVSVGYKF